MNCINLDPHADFRPLERRHSGNGFSYAKAHGFLDKYSIVALHENYNSQSMIDQMKEDGVNYSSFELSFEEAIKKGLAKIKKSPYGVELDCDSIQDFPSSAQTPSGISANQARYYIHEADKHKNAWYLHLPEAAPSLVKDSEEQVGKLLAYLVSDFIKGKGSQ